MDVGQVDGSKTTGRVGRDSGHTSLITLTALCRVIVILDVYRDPNPTEIIIRMDANSAANASMTQIKSHKTQLLHL